MSTFHIDDMVKRISRASSCVFLGRLTKNVSRWKYVLSVLKPLDVMFKSNKIVAFEVCGYLAVAMTDVFSVTFNLQFHGILLEHSRLNIKGVRTFAIEIWGFAKSMTVGFEIEKKKVTFWYERILRSTRVLFNAFLSKSLA